MIRAKTLAGRIAAGVALGVSFVLMASVFVPHGSRADLMPPAPPAPSIPLAPPESSALLSVDPHEGLRSLGSIVNDCYLINLYAGEGGPWYSVFDARDGRELGTLLTAEKVAAWFPELPIPGMASDGTLMLADPARDMP